jgi:molecular chaperone DnaK (HSP70)
VAAWADRGNFPVLSFPGPDDVTRDFMPALVATNGLELRYGWQAWPMIAAPGWSLTRSLKRLLDTAGPNTRVDLGPIQLPLVDVLAGLALELKRALPADQPLEVMIGVPANSNSNQRYLTAEAFRLAGFHVLGLLNEPSAAGVEYGHAAARRSAEELLLIYDLGGGTFDASLVEMRNGEHEVIASEGISTLGGDDFDAAMAEMALTPEQLDALDQDALFRLHELCRQLKESLNPNSRRLVLDLESVQPGLGIATVSVADYYDRCRPLLDETLHAVEDLLAAADQTAADCLYVTGGGSELPLVPRILRERFGRRVKRSAYTRAATAIGLAIHADGQAGFSLRERFTRYLGVWREAEGGREIVFDPVFGKGTPLPRAGEPPIERARRYRPAHNLGHFRYLEASAVDESGRPAGDITLWDDILFPFDRATEAEPDLWAVPVRYSAAAASQSIAETWYCAANGAVEVELRNETSGHARRFRLGRWNSGETAVRPVRTRRSKVKK